MALLSRQFFSYTDALIFIHIRRYAFNLVTTTLQDLNENPELDFETTIYVLHYREVDGGTTPLSF